MTFAPGQAPPNAGRTFPGEVMSRAEVAAILRQCSRRAPTGVRDRALITMMYRAGLRVSEALALRPSDIDMKAGTVRVRHGKGDKARTVSVGDGALAVVQLWLAARKAAGIPPNGGRPLFCTLSGTPLSDGQVRQMLRRRAGRAGVEKRVHPHALRHSRAHEMHVDEHVPVGIIQQFLGHSSIAVTDAYLRHIAPADVIEVGRADDWEDE